jgi:hypothetical protein
MNTADLGLLSPTVALRHERLAPQQSHLTFALLGQNSIAEPTSVG